MNGNGFRLTENVSNETGGVRPDCALKKCQVNGFEPNNLGSCAAILSNGFICILRTLLRVPALVLDRVVPVEAPSLGGLAVRHILLRNGVRYGFHGVERLPLRARFIYGRLSLLPSDGTALSALGIPDGIDRSCGGDDGIRQRPNPFGHHFLFESLGLVCGCNGAVAQ